MRCEVYRSSGVTNQVLTQVAKIEDANNQITFEDAGGNVMTTIANNVYYEIVCTPEGMG